MAAHRQHRRGAVVALLALCAWLLPALLPATAHAHNTYAGSHRRWPWEAGIDNRLTTLPGECPHCPGVQSSSSWKAIDATLNYEIVHAISSGTIDRWEPSGGKAGKYVRIKDDDGTYITYEHLSRALVTSGRVRAGQPIAVSGCTGNCTGPHLHFQRHAGPSFSSTALPLGPISGHGGSIDSLAHTAYTSDNAAVASNRTGTVWQPMLAAYDAAGARAKFGAPADVGVAWSPCRTQLTSGTWWRYWCGPRQGIAGSVQTFLGPNETPRAIMQAYGASQAFALPRGILAAYTEIYAGHDWVWWLGYPASNRFASATGGFKQNFEHGYVRFYEECREDMFLDGAKVATYHFCD